MASKQMSTFLLFRRHHEKGGPAELGHEMRQII